MKNDNYNKWKKMLILNWGYCFLMCVIPIGLLGFFSDFGIVAIADADSSDVFIPLLWLFGLLLLLAWMTNLIQMSQIENINDRKSLIRIIRNMRILFIFLFPVLAFSHMILAAFELWDDNLDILILGLLLIDVIFLIYCFRPFKKKCLALNQKSAADLLLGEQAWNRVLLLIFAIASLIVAGICSFTFLNFALA